MVGSVLGVGSVLLLSAMLFPSLPDSAAAEEAESKVSLSVSPVLAVSLQDELALEVTPTEGGSFTAKTASLSISTNNETGYSMYLATQDNNNTLTSQNPNTSDVITALDGGESGLTPTEFTANTWGYSLASGTTEPSDTTRYQAVPAETGSTAVVTKDTPVDTDTYSLMFGAKVDTSLPSGTYSNQVVVSAVANPKVVSSWSELTTMQEMTSAICATANEGDTKQLTDTRDGKKYWVTKLADGNCWMTQNLDFDIPASGLTSADSDINNESGVWNASSDYPPHSTEQPGTITSANTNTGTYSWDLGMYVKSDPDGYSDYCGGSSIKGLADASCASAGWTDVSSMTPMADGTTNEVISTDNNTYNAHYLVGNLYQWNAATAGTGKTITSQEATDSICPKGWKLPTSNNSNSGSFGGLVGSLNSTTITQAPYYFNPSGYVYSGSLWNAGNEGDYWSSTAYSNTSRAYYLYFSSGSVYPSRYYYRYYGQSVRCLAR